MKQLLHALYPAGIILLRGGLLVLCLLWWSPRTQAAEVTPLNLPTLTHAPWGTTVTRDSWVMVELAREPQWTSPPTVQTHAPCPMTRWQAEAAGPSLALARALLRQGALEELPAQPTHRADGLLLSLPVDPLP